MAGRVIEGGSAMAGMALRDDSLRRISSKRQVCLSDVNDPIRHPDTSNVLVFGQINVLLAESARCGSRSWQRAPWEAISAGGWPRRAMTWRSLRAARMATPFAATVSK